MIERVKAMTNDKKLQMALKRKVVLRETMGGSCGYKLSQCVIVFIGQGWYRMEADGYSFEFKWYTIYGNKKTIIYFRNNAQLDKSGYCVPEGVDSSRVRYASSLYFGCGLKLINVLWVLGEVLESRKSWEYSKNE